MNTRLILLLSAGISFSYALGQTPIKDVLAKIEPGSGKATDTSTEFTINGIVSVRTTLPDGQVIAFVHPPGETGVPVLATTNTAAGLVPRNDVTLSGHLADGPLGWSGLVLKEGSLAVNGTNRPFGNSVPVGADFFKDASSLAGRYVQLTNVTLADARFNEAGTAQARADGGVNVGLILGRSAGRREAPVGALNVFGVPVRKDGQWQLLVARLLPVNGRSMQNLAMKHTCFTCHNPDTKIIGPAYRDVAARYRDDPEAPAKLIRQMENGGSGKWGPVPMLPFTGKVPAEDMKQLAEWILAYRWDSILAD